MNHIFRKLLLSCATVICTAGFAVAQDLIPDQNQKGKWGYVDADGKKVINYDYNHANAFIDGRALVQKGDKWGYINERGKEVIKIKFSEMGTWNGAYCKVSEGGKVEDGVVTGAKYGYIDRNGEYVLKTEYDEIGPFVNDIAYVKKDNKFGYIDKRFNFVIPCKYSSIGSFNEKGFCWVKDGNNYGVYNIQGDIVIPANYKALGTFNAKLHEANPLLSRMMNDPDIKAKIKEYGKEHASELASAYKANKNPFSFKAGSFDNDALKKYNEGLLNCIKDATDGMLTDEDKMLIYENTPYDIPSYTFISGKNFSQLDMEERNYFVVSNSGMAAGDSPRNYILSCNGDKIGIFSSTGEEVLKIGKFDIAFLPSEGIVPVARYKKEQLQVNYYRVSSDKLLFKDWQEAYAISPFVNGTAVVYKDGMNYLVDRNGKTISDYYAVIMPAVDGVHVMGERNRYGLLDDKGGEILKPSYMLILPKKEGVHCSQKERGGLYGYIDDNGKDVIPAKYEMAKSFKHGVAAVKGKNGWGIIDHETNPIVELKWEDIVSFDSPKQEVAWVKENGQWCCLDIASKSIKFRTDFATVYNFDEKGHAVVCNADGKFGSVNMEGETVIPTAIDDLEKVEECFALMEERGTDRITDTDVYRFNIYNSDKRNKYNLSDKIDSNMWDY